MYRLNVFSVAEPAALVHCRNTRHWLLAASEVWHLMYNNCVPWFRI